MFDMDFKVKGKQDVFSIVVLGVYLAVMASIVLEGVYGMDGSDAMGYSILAYYMVLPALSLIAAMLLGVRRHPVKWLAPVLFAVVGYAMPVPVFKYADTFTALVALISAVIGLGLGLGIMAFRKIREKQRSY